MTGTHLGWRGRAGRAAGHAIRRALAVPGAAVLLALTAGAIAGTTLPGATADGNTPGAFGPFTLALGPAGALTTVGLMLTCVGAQIAPRKLAPVGSRVVVVLAGATAVPAVAVFAYGWLFGPDGWHGISLLAAAVAAVCTSNAVWLPLARRYGTDTDAWGGTVAAAVNSGPVVPLILLAAWGHGQAPVPWPALADAVAPLLIGFLIGVAGQDGARTAMRAAIPYLMLAFSVQLGARLNLVTLLRQAPDGLLLGLAVAGLSGAAVALGWLLVLRRPAAVGWGAAAVTIGAPIVPGVVAVALPVWQPYAATAAAQVGVAVVVSSVVAVVASALTYRLSQQRHRPAAPAPPQAAPVGAR